MNSNNLLENKFISMKTAFIITSAIKFKDSSLSEQLVRLQQTINTIQSIKLKVKDAQIFLVEVGSDKLNQEWLRLFPKDVKILSLVNNQRISSIQDEAAKNSKRMFTKYTSHGKTPEQIKQFIKIGYIKSITEHFALSVLFKMQDFSMYDLVFKISGRYFLNEDFVLSNYSTKGITAKKIGEDSQYTSLWSFSGNYFNQLKNLWPIVLKNMLIRFNSDKITDIEQCMHLTYSESEIPNKYINTLGVTGIINSPFRPYLLSS